MNNEQYINKIRKKLKELTSLVAISGYEDRVIDFVVEDLLVKHKDIKVDQLGNVTVKIKGTKNPESSEDFRVMIFAHMDELGLVVRKIERNGFLRLERVGGIPEKSLSGTKLIIQTNDSTFEGVIGTKSHHLTTPSEKYKVLPIEEIYADFGFTSHTEVKQAGINVGTIVGYARQFFHNGPIVFGNALDNRVGCLILLELAEQLQAEELSCELYLVFSVQEEFNLRGVLPAIRAIDPHLAITLDITVATDTPDLINECEIILGAGPSIGLYSFHGRGTLGGLIPNPKLVHYIIEIANLNNITLQPAVFKGILTDASFAQLENKGFPIIDLGYPARYTHSPIEVIHLDDIVQLIEVLMKFLKIADGTLNLSRGSSYKKDTQTDYT